MGHIERSIISRDLATMSFSLSFCQTLTLMPYAPCRFFEDIWNLFEDIPYIFVPKYCIFAVYHIIRCQPNAKNRRQLRWSSCSFKSVRQNGMYSLCSVNIWYFRWINNDKCEQYGSNGNSMVNRHHQKNSHHRIIGFFLWSKQLWNTKARIYISTNCLDR